MKNSNSSYVPNNNVLNEHLKRILNKSHYVINEANYSLVDNMDDDDTVPEDIWVGPQPVTNHDSTIFEDEDEIENEETVDDVEQISEPQQNEPIEQDQEEEVTTIETQERSADEIQSHILKLNISAMQKMQKVVGDLNATVDSLNFSVGELKNDVEEVKEPTNIEKLMNKKEDSHPFYYNLNDMWRGNAFQARKDVEDNGGIVKLEDGSYVADFDDLPKHSRQEIIDSLKKY